MIYILKGSSVHSMKISILKPVVSELYAILRDRRELLESIKEIRRSDTSGEEAYQIETLVREDIQFYRRQIQAWINVIREFERDKRIEEYYKANN